MSLWQWIKNRKDPYRPNVTPCTTELDIPKNKEINNDIEETVAYFNELLGENDDFLVRRFRVFGSYSAALITFSELVDESRVNEDILKSLINVPPHLEKAQINRHMLKDTLLNDALSHIGCKVERYVPTMVEDVLRGKTLIVVDGMREGLVIHTRHIDHRSVDEPDSERVIRGPRDGFIEVLDANIGLLRYRLPDANLRIKSLKVGRKTKTKVVYCYLGNIANPSLVEEVERRMSAIDIDAVLDSGYVEQFIEDHHFSPFPQINNTERPDKAVANLLEGKVIIFVDGTPSALIVPTVFSQFYQTPEDYVERFLIGSLIRLIRILAIVFSLIFPAIYVSLISFHPELIPTEFAVAIAGGRAGVPYPPVVEVFIMETAMEVLREATIRLPQQVGGALSIVGVLIIGDAAVAAGLASPITIVVIAITTIGSFATPAYNAAIALRMLRFPLIILSGLFGLYGVMVGVILIVNHMLSLRSFGVPYISPLAPLNWQGLKDTLIRGPLWWMRIRPSIFHPLDDKRLSKEMVRFGKAPSNTLDPLKVGNERWEEEDGASARNDRRTSYRDPD